MHSGLRVSTRTPGALLLRVTRVRRHGRVHSWRHPTAEPRYILTGNIQCHVTEKAKCSLSDAKCSLNVP